MAIEAAKTDISRERSDLLEAPATHRYLLRLTVDGITNPQAAQRPTISQLCLGGLIKHVAEVEAGWVDFILHGPAAMSPNADLQDTDWNSDDWLSKFQMLPGETLSDLLERYGEIAGRTDELVVVLPNLDDAHPLPKAPWFEEGARWSARRVLLHIIAETAQHAGHADIIRESLDGSKSMG